MDDPEQDLWHKYPEPNVPTGAKGVQVGGGHYKEYAIQPITFIQANELEFCVGNVIKYVCRHRFKNGVEDLKKAKHYIDFILEHEYGKVP